MEIILHIGLHKTATKFFQHKVFKFIPKKELIYNPPKLTQLISDLLKADEQDLDLVLSEIEKEINNLERKPTNKILISREIMSGNPFDFYKNFSVTSFRLSHALNSNVKVICFFRYQMDWIKSCYRETLHEHHYQKIEQFFEFKKGEDKFVKANYKDLSWVNVANSLIKNFSSEHCFFFFYEDFKNQRENTLKLLADIIGLKTLEVFDQADRIPNRGYSSFSIKLSIFRYRLLSKINLNSLIHRPIFFFGEKSIPAGFENLSVLPKKEYWGSYFHRDNEEVRSNNYPNLTLGEKVRQITSWRYIIKNIIDKIYYYDDGVRLNPKQESKMEQFFYRENSRLKKCHKMLEELPKIYKY